MSRETVLPDGTKKTSEVEERVPTEEGDRYLCHSIDAARIAWKVEENDATRHALAQSLTVHAERLLARDLGDAARPLIVEASKLLNEDENGNGDVASLKAQASNLRAKLGAARPVFRPGR